MTIKECYEQMRGNYEEARKRLMNDALIERFMLKFPQDTTMQQLRDALTAEDYELAFRAIHTLKGVAGNLAFSALQESASALTEQLRGKKEAPEAHLVRAVEEDYTRIIENLTRYRNDKK